jgi:hypothetical protein
MIRDALAPVFAWLGHSALGMEIRSSAVLIALTQIIHLLGLTMLIGTLLMVDMTMMGVGFRRYTVAQVARELAPWTTGGLIVMLVSGPLILSSESLKCFESSFFWMKMIGLAVAIIFHFTAHRIVAQADPPVPHWRARLVASISLALWIGIAIAGKMIGIYGDDLRREPPPFQVRISDTGASPLTGRQAPAARATVR